MARPTLEQQKLITKRNLLIRSCLAEGLSQTEVAYIFRIPRNTVNTVKKSPFYKWLTSKQNLRRDDIVGDLAEDALRDSRAPINGGISEWRARVAGTAAREALEEAWKEYKGK